MTAITTREAERLVEQFAKSGLTLDAAAYAAVAYYSDEPMPDFDAVCRALQDSDCYRHIAAALAAWQLTNTFVPQRTRANVDHPFSGRSQSAGQRDSRPGAIPA